MISSTDPSSNDTGGDHLLADIIDQLHKQVHRGEPVELDAILEAYPQYSTEIRDLYGMVRTVTHGITAPSAPTPDLVPGALGDYRLLREVGRGGMAVVYEAQQISLNRSVALKVLPFAAMFDARQLQRFKNEAAAAASLHHENIVPVYALGCHRSVHFYAMQFIEGHTIASLISDLRAGGSPLDALTSSASNRSSTAGDRAAAIAVSDSTDARTKTRRDGESSWQRSSYRAYFRFVARLCEQVARALDYAHQQGIVHRDIKPSNLMLDEAGKIWVTDFGLALLEHDSELTISGSFVGTLRYMSPEQTRSQRQLVDHRTDIYSLGATLYELLTWRPLFMAEDREELITSVREGNVVPPRKINTQIPRDLETITLKAIAREADERYSTAESFAHDLARFLADEPIHARRASAVQRVSKWAKRHSLGLSLVLVAVTLLAITLLSATIWISGLYRVAEQHAQLAEGNAQRAADSAQRAEQKHREAARSATRLHIQQARQQLERGDAVGLLQLVRAMELSEGLTEFEDLPQMWAQWQQQFAGHLIQVVGHDGPVNALASHPGGDVLATAGSDGMIRIWNLPDGKPLRAPLSVSSSAPAALDVTFSAAGNLIAAGFADGTACIWSVDDDYDLRHVLQHGKDRVRRVRFSPTGALLATASDVDEHLRLWDVQSGRPRYRPLVQQGSVHDVDFSTDGSLLALGNASKKFAVWRLDTTIQRHSMPPHEYTINFVRFVDEQLFLTVSMDHIVRLWSTSSTEPRTTSSRLKGVVSQIAVHRPASLVAVGTRDGQVALWNYDINEVIDLDKVHRSHVDAISFSPDGSMLATGSRDGTARVWDLATHQPVGPWIRHQDRITDVAFAADGRMVFTSAQDGTVRFWNVGIRGPAVELGEASGSGVVRFGPTGKRLGTLLGNKLNLFRVDDDGASLKRCIHEWENIADFAFDPTGTVIATATSTHTVRFWNAQNGTSIGLPVFHRDWVRSVAYSPDGRWLAAGTGSADRSVWLYRVDSGVPRTDTKIDCPSGITSLSFSPAGQTLALGTHHGLALLDLQHSNRPAKTIISDSTASVTFDASGRRLAVGLRYPIAFVLNSSGEQLGPPLSHDGRVTSVSFAPDGKSLATGSVDGRARIWYGLESPYRYCAALAHPKTVAGVSFSPTGRWLATTSSDSRVRLWPIPSPPTTVESAKRQSWYTVGARISGDGEQLSAIPWRERAEINPWASTGPTDGQPP